MAPRPDEVSVNTLNFLTKFPQVIKGVENDSKASGVTPSADNPFLGRNEFLAVEKGNECDSIPIMRNAMSFFSWLSSIL